MKRVVVGGTLNRLAAKASLQQPCNDTSPAVWMCSVQYTQPQFWFVAESEYKEEECLLSSQFATDESLHGTQLRELMLINKSIYNTKKLFCFSELYRGPCDQCAKIHDWIWNASQDLWRVYDNFCWLGCVLSVISSYVRCSVAPSISNSSKS